MSFRTALQRLKAHEPKQLIAGRYEECGYGCCALGVVVPVTRQYASTAIGELVMVSWAVREALRELGMDEHEAERLQRVNDDYSGLLSKRYDHVVAWLEAEVAKEPA